MEGGAMITMLSIKNLMNIQCYVINKNLVNIQNMEGRARTAML